jgi:hypothetical protein
MTTVVIDDKKKGAQEILDLLRALDFVFPIDTISENNQVLSKRKKLIKVSQKYNPLALAGAAENHPLHLTQIRKEWTKMK